MQRNELLATIEQLCNIELDILDRDELAAVVAASARVRGWLDTVDLRCSRRGRTLADAGRAEPSAAMLARIGNRSTRDANQIDRRDKVAQAMPALEDALHDGTVSAGHLDAVANATRNAPPEVRAAFAVHEHEVTAFAATDTIEVFTRRCRALVTKLTTEHTGNDATELDRQRSDSNIRTWIDNETGMHHTHAALDPLRHEILWNAINRNLRQRQQHDSNARTPWNQMQVDALIDAVQDGTTPHPRRPAPGPAPGTSAPPDPASSPPSPAARIAHDLAAAVHRNLVANGYIPDEPDDPDPGDDPAYPDDANNNDDSDPETELRRIEQRVPEISVLADLTLLTDALHTDGLHTHGICETEDGHPLPLSTVRRLCCDAEIIPIFLNGDRVPLELGRTARTVNRAQRRALRAMHRTCAHPDCDVPFSHTKIHHVQWWTRDLGPTDIDNLLPLCERHHHLVHEGRWNLTMTPDRTATWTRPDGTTHHHGTTIDRHPPTGSPPGCSPPNSTPPNSTPSDWSLLTD
jgi:hypothetical protein